MNDSLDPILQQEEQRKLRNQLMWRLGIAALLVGGVLGTLAWLEQEKDQKPQVSMVAPRDVRIAPAASSITASAPASASAPAASSPLVATPEPRLASTPASAPTSVALPPPLLTSAASQPASTPQTLTKAAPYSPTPTISKPAAPTVAPVTLATPVRPVEPVKPVPVPAIKPVEPVKTIEPVKSAIAPTPPPSALPPPTKLARQAAAPAAQYPTPVATPNGFTVQAGVFLHASNAEKMLTSMQSAGVPAYLETRVQIGPFSNRVEAEAAVKKLRQLGIEPVIKGN